MANKRFPIKEDGKNVWAHEDGLHSVSLVLGSSAGNRKLTQEMAETAAGVLQLVPQHPWMRYVALKTEGQGLVEGEGQFL